MLKDLKLAADAARSVGAYTPMGGEAEELYQRFVDRGGGNKDFSGIIKMIDDSWKVPDNNRRAHAHCDVCRAAPAYSGVLRRSEKEPGQQCAGQYQRELPPDANRRVLNAMVMLAAAPTKDQALKIMHERHEGMEDHR